MRMTEDYDLEQPVAVHWVPVDLVPPQEIGGGNERRFATLREAIWFIMEDLPPRDRANAQIAAREGALHIEQIEILFEEMKDD
jgi:hypothetical protein